MSTAKTENDEGINVTADAVIDRLKIAMQVGSDTELAEALELNKSTVSTWRSREKVPYAEVVKIALATRQNIDWILTGREREEWIPGVFDGAIDPTILAAALYDVWETKLFNSWDLPNVDLWRRMTHKARVLLWRYNHFEYLRADFTKEDRMGPKEFSEYLMKSLGISDEIAPRSTSDHPAKKSD